MIMPKSKFDAFYYGVGMKLDEASVDEAGKKLEGKLNKVVDNVTKNLTTISDAVAKGVKDVDTKKLVKSLVDAQKELNQFQNFDPSKLQDQIDGLKTSFESLKTDIGDVGKDLNEFINQTASRLSSIEIKTSKQGKDALKADLKEMKTLAQGFSQILANGEKVDTSALDKYFQKVKAGFASLKASGNPMELFADKELANYFVDLTNILRQMGAPVEDLRADFFELSSTFKGFFTKSDATGAQTIFKNVGYQIESVASELRKAKAELADYEAQMAQLSARTKTTGFDITIDDDKNLSFEKKIERIREYGDIVSELDYGEEWAIATRHQIALIQAAEKELGQALKTDAGKDMLAKWQKSFGKYDSTNKFSAEFISDYVNVAQQELAKLQNMHAQTLENIKQFQEDIGRLQATEKVTTSKKTNQSSKSTTQKQKADGVVAEVQAKIKINEAEWAKTINAALANLESKGKIKPVKIPVTTTQGTTLKNIQEQAKKIREMALANPKDEGGTDIKSFNHKFTKFLDNLKLRKEEIASFLKDEWLPVLKDAFTFRMELLGIDNKSMTENIATHMLPTVDAINKVLENKPIIFHSNIDTLVEEIQSKLQDIKIDIGAGNVNVNSQGLSNVNLIVNGIAGRNGGTTPPTVSPIISPTPTPTVPSAPSVPTEKPNSGSTDKQAIYNDAIDKFTKWIGGFTDPGEALKLVAKQAQKLYTKLDLAEEGTDAYYEAQIQLAVLLGKWRGTIGGKYAKEGFRVPGVGKRWNKYLTESGIIPDPKNSKVIGSMSALETTYGLKKPSATSGSTKPSKSITATAMQDAEGQMANQLEAGRKIVENYIKLAKWAKALGPIAEGADIEIKESDFKDKDSIWRNGHNYTKADVGMVVPGKKITFEDLDAFIAEYEQSANEEDRQLFNFLKNLIDAYKSNQQRLDSLLEELSDSDVVGRYEFTDNKKETLATDTQSAYKTIMGKKGSKKAQQHLTDVFGKYNIDLSELPSAKTYAEQWQIIEQQIIGRKGLNFEGLMSELGSLKGNVGKTYENFMTLLKVSRAYMLASNSLSEVGQEASVLMRGKREKTDREIREYDPSIGRTRGTGKYIEGGKNSIVVEGLRQELRKLAVVFIDELGNAIAGVNAGKNVASDYLGINETTSFTKIIAFLTNALNQAAEIAIDTRKPGMKGYENVTKWDSEEYVKRQTRPMEEYKDWTTETTEKGELDSQIAQLKNTKATLEKDFSELNKQLDNAGATTDDFKKIIELSSQISAKKNTAGDYNEKIVKLKQEIDALKNNLTNPETTYENILTQLLQEEENLQKLKRELVIKKEKTGKKIHNPEISALEKKISTQKNTVEGLKRSLGVTNRDASDTTALDLIALEEKKLIELEDKFNTQKEDIKFKKNKQEIERLRQEKEPLMQRINALRGEIDTIKSTTDDPEINNLEKQVADNKQTLATFKDKKLSEEQEQEKQRLLSENASLIQRIAERKKQVGLSENQQSDIQKKQQEIDALLIQTKEYAQQIDPLQAEVSVYDRELTWLTEDIKTKKKYIETLRNSLKTRKKVKTPEEINQEIDNKTAELLKLQDEKRTLEGNLTGLETEEDKLVTQKIAQLQEEKTIAENRLKTLNAELSKGDSKNTESLQIEKANLEKQIASLNKEIEAWNSKSIIQTVSLLQQQAHDLQERIQNINAQIAGYQNKLTTAQETVKYSKSYEQASRSLPIVSEELKARQTHYKAEEKAYTMMREVGLVKAKASSQAEYDALLKVALPLEELNKKLISGKMTEKEYVDQIAKAHTTILGMSKEEAEEEARALKDQIVRIHKLQEEKKILEEIIRTQKPKEQPIEQPISQNSDKPKKKSQDTSLSSAQPTNGGVQITTGEMSSATIDGGILLNLDNSGLAKDITVQAIYKLLSVKKNGDVDSKIEEIKKAIATKEEEARAKAEEERKIAEAEVARKKAEEEAQRKAAEAKVEQERKAAETEAARKKAEAEAAEKARIESDEKARVEAEKRANEEKKRTEEVAKQAASEKQKTEDAQKQAVSEKIETQESQKQVVASQEFENSIKRIIKDLMNALSGEQTYKISGGRVTPTPEQMAKYKTQKDDALNSLMSIFSVEPKDINAFAKSILPKNIAFKNGFGASGKAINSIYGSLISQYGANVQNPDQIIHEFLDPVKQVLNKEVKNLFASAHKMYQEIAAQNRIFRELSFASKNGVIDRARLGLSASVHTSADRETEMLGHLHPRNSMYSSDDIDMMEAVRQHSPVYNKDVLITPDFVYQLTDMSKVNVSALIKLRETLEALEHGGLSTELVTKAKESVFSYFAQENGISFSKSTYDSLGRLIDITNETPIINKDALDALIQYTKESKNNKHDPGSDYATWQKRKKLLYEKANTDPLVKSLAANTLEDKRADRIYQDTNRDKMRSGTLIQEAIDYDFDLSLFIQQFKDFFEAMDMLGEKVKSNSALGTLQKYVQEISSVEVGSDKYKELLDKIKLSATDVFKKSETPQLDKRFLSELYSIARKDETAKINKTILSERLSGRLVDTVYGDNIPAIDKMSLDELKAELSNLERLRDSDEVDPRFATAEKQDVIIDLLKNGIKVSGKTGSEGDKKSTAKTVKMPNTAKVDTQFDEISKLDGLNKESSLYKRYMSAKSNFDDAYKNALAQDKNLTKEDADKVKAIATEVTKLGRKIIEASSSLEQFKSRGGQAFESTANEVKTLKDEMLELAYQNASTSKMLLSDVSYDEATQKMSYSLTDLEGNVTKVTMAYNDLFGSILTMSDKTTNSVGKIYKTIEGEMINRIGVDDAVKNTPMFGESNEYQSYITAYNSMMDAQDTLRVKGELATKEEKDNLISLTNEVANTRSEFEKLVKASAEFKAKVGDNFIQLDSDFDTNILSSKMKEFVLNSNNWTKSQRDMIEQTWSFKDAQNEATYSVVDGNKKMSSMSVIFDEGARRIGQYTVETKKYQTGMEKFMDSLEGKWQEVARYLMSFGSLYRVWAVLKQGVQYIKEIDSALTELKKVTDETEETYDRFLNTAAKTADKVGSTIQEVVSSTADWARIGYSLQDAATLAESTAVLLNVSEFQSIDEATSALTSTLQAFGYVAEDSMQVVDVMNEIGNNYAISSDGIATALQDSASSLMAANNSYQEAVALIAAANRVVILRHGL